MKHFKILVPLVFLMAIQYFYFEHQLELLAQQSSQIAQPSSESTQTLLQLPSFATLAEKARSSVVSIEVFNGEVERRIGGMGSGFIISDDGYLLTNFHVTHGARRLVVRLANGSEYDAEVIGSDPETDLSLLKINVTGLQPFAFGNVEETRVGSWVVAIGAPFGLEQSVTAGIVSAKGRSVGEQYVPYIQTDVAINVGNSGGPLINMDGKVVGVNSKIYSTDGGSVGLSFAIPIDLAIDVVDQLKSDGRVRRGFLGVRYQAVTKKVAENYSLQQNRGAMINEVTRNSPAERTGLKVGDIVIAVDGKPIVNYTELPFLIGRIRPGNEAALSVIRDGREETFTIIVGSRGDSPVIAFNSLPLPEPAANPLAIRVAELPEAVRQAFELEEGVFIDQVDAGPAQRAGLREGDVILSIQSMSISKLEDFDAAMANLPSTGTLTVLVTRPGQGARYLVVDLE